MATIGKKRKREIQDENTSTLNNFDYLKLLNEQKRRRLQEEEKKRILQDLPGYTGQNWSHVVKFPDKPPPRRSERTPGSASKNSRRASLPLLPSRFTLAKAKDVELSIETEPEPPLPSDDINNLPTGRDGATPKIMSLGAKRRMVQKKREETRDASDAMSLHSIDEIINTPRRGMRRSLSGFARRSLRNLKGSIKDKVSEKMRQSLMTGKQDYSLPLLNGEMSFVTFFSAQPHVEHPKTDEEKDQYLQQKIDHEIRMRDGTAKLLAASKHPQQMLEAAKNLLTSNSRMIAYMSELQRRKTHEVLQKNKAADGNQIPCQGKVAVSELRIPLMWKDSDHFRNKGDHRRYAVFCLWKIGTEIYDTTILKDVDRSMTDLSFEDVIVFNDIKPDFECQLEIYCHKLCEDLTMASTHRRIKKKFNEISTHVGRSVGKRLSGVKDESDFMSNMLVGPKFEVIANATLKLADITNSTATYDLGTDPAQVATEGGAAELPLFGHFCCRVAAQPHCMVKETASGFLRVKNGKSWERNWCQLKGMTLSCYDTPTGPDSNKKPCLKMKIQKNTQVLRGSPGSSSGQDFCFQLSSSSKFSKTQIFAADSDAELEKWWQALQQNLLDLALWQHACDENVEMPEIPSHRQSSYISRSSQRGSLYDETQLKDDVPDSPMSRILARLNVSEEDDELESKLSGNGSKKGEMKVETDV